jgi:hypothetical protein
MFALITKVNEGESNTDCPSTLEVTYSSDEKLSKALFDLQKHHRNQALLVSMVYS